VKPALGWPVPREAGMLVPEIGTKGLSEPTRTGEPWAEFVRLGILTPC